MWKATEVIKRNLNAKRLEYVKKKTKIDTKKKVTIREELCNNRIGIDNWRTQHEESEKELEKKNV